MFWESYNNTSYLLSYNRNTGAYQPLVISGSPIYIENCTTYMSQNLNNSDPSVALYGRAVGVSGTADNTQQPLIRLFRGGTGGVQNSVSANILFGSNTANIDGISNVRFQLSSSPVSGNGWGSSADTTVMTLVGNGNVGIGTTSPSNRFHVHSSSYPNIKLTTDDNYVTAIDFDSTNKTGGKHWRIMSTHQSAGEGQGKFCIQNVTDGVVRMAIQAGGEVGIGTNTPSYKLHVSGDVYANTYRVAGNAAVYWESWGGGWYMVDSAWVRTYNEKNIWSGAGNICTAGRIGVGLADPVTKLHIFESSGTQAGADAGSIILDHDNSGGASSITFRSKVNRSSDYGYIQYQDAISVGVGGESSRLIIGTQNDGDDHIILSPSGSVGVGTNSPIAKLHVAGTGYFTGPGGGGTNGSVLITGSDLWGHSLYVATSQVQKRLAFNHDGGSANIFSYDYGSSVAQNLVLQSPGGNLLIGNTLAIFYPSGGDKFVVHANGSNGNNGYFYYNASNNYGTASDRRIKDNIVAINEETAMSFIETLEPSEFTMVNQTTQMSGFIAQNVLNAAQTDGQRSSVNNWQSFDENDPDSPLLGVSDRPILANLVSAFKKLRKEYLITRQQLDAKTNELDTLKEFLRTKFPGEI